MAATSSSSSPYAMYTISCAFCTMSSHIRAGNYLPSRWKCPHCPWSTCLCCGGSFRECPPQWHYEGVGKCSAYIEPSKTRCLITSSQKDEKNNSKAKKRMSFYVEEQMQLETLSLLEALRLQEQEDKCAFDHEMACKLDQRIFDCPICFETLPQDDVFRTKGCQTSGCLDCVREYVLSSIRDGVVPVSCFSCKAKENSSCFFSEQELQLLVDDKHWNLYLQHSLNTALQGADDLYRCRAPDCKGLCFLAPPLETFICPLDGTHKYCVKCGADGGHSGVTCEQHRDARLKEAEVAADEKFRDGMGANTYWQCPGCKTPIERSSGCPKMTCSRCRCVYCNTCGKAIAGDPYLHTNACRG